MVATCALRLAIGDAHRHQPDRRVLLLRRLGPALRRGRLRVAAGGLPKPTPLPSGGDDRTSRSTRSSFLCSAKRISFADLVAALDRIDWPRDRLDIKLIVEADDADTIAAARRGRAEPPYEVIVVPVAEPRTKPKALAFALPFARGEFVTVYDAEDRAASPSIARGLCGVRALAAGTRLPAGGARRSTTATPACSRACSPSNIRRCSTACCRRWRLSACRCRSAERPIIFAARRSKRSADGIRSMSPRTPISAFASPGSAIARRPSPCRPTRKRRHAAAVAPAAHALVQGLDADVAGPHPPSPAASPRLGWRGVPRLQSRRHRHHRFGAGPSDLSADAARRCRPIRSSVGRRQRVRRMVIGVNLFNLAAGYMAMAFLPSARCAARPRQRSRR